MTASPIATGYSTTTRPRLRRRATASSGAQPTSCWQMGRQDARARLGLRYLAAGTLAGQACQVPVARRIGRAEEQQSQVRRPLDGVRGVLEGNLTDARIARRVDPFRTVHDLRAAPQAVEDRTGRRQLLDEPIESGIVG